MSTQQIHDQIDRNELQHDAFDSLGRPRALWGYWGWLLGRCPTEAIELLLAAISSWWAILLIYSLLVIKNSDSTTIHALTLNAPITLWIVALFLIAGAKLVGVLFRVGWLRFFGLLGSVGTWMTIAAVAAKISTSPSPVWGAYAILGLASSWAFIRRVWESSDPLIDNVRDRLRRRRETRGAADVHRTQPE